MKQVKPKEVCVCFFVWLRDKKRVSEGRLGVCPAGLSGETGMPSSGCH